MNKKFLTCTICLILIICGYYLYCKIYSIPFFISGSGNESYLESFIEYEECSDGVKEIAHLEFDNVILSIFQYQENASSLAIVEYYFDNRVPKRYYLKSVSRFEYDDLGSEMIWQNISEGDNVFYSVNNVYKENVDYDGQVVQCKSYEVEISDIEHSIFIYYLSA